MAGRGPAPNPNSRRGIARKTRGHLTLLPGGGYAGPVPEWPLDMDAKKRSEVELEIWQRVWRLPQAAQWVRMGCDRTVALYCRVQALAEDGATQAHLAEARQLSEALGLTPTAMLRLKWDIADPDDADLRAPADLSALEDLDDLLGGD